MKISLLVLILIPGLLSCSRRVNTGEAKNEILQTERDFEKMLSEKGPAAAFYFFAAENAAILRGNDSLIIGNENIGHFYEVTAKASAKLSWIPDFVGVSDCGTLGYTYGKYSYSTQDTAGRTVTRAGIFHTVWKKEKNGWRFVWD